MMIPLIDYTPEQAGRFAETMLRHLPEMSKVSTSTHLGFCPPLFHVSVTIDGRSYSRQLDRAPWQIPDADIYPIATDIVHEHWQSLLDI